MSFRFVIQEKRSTCVGTDRRHQSSRRWYNDGGFEIGKQKECPCANKKKTNKSTVLINRNIEEEGPINDDTKIAIKSQTKTHPIVWRSRGMRVFPKMAN